MQAWLPKPIRKTGRVKHMAQANLARPKLTRPGLLFARAGQQVLPYLLLGSSLLLSSCAPYVQNLLRYQFAGIEDYQIFESLTVKAGQAQAWEKAEHYNRAEIDSPTLKTIESFDPVAFLVIQDGKLLYEQYWKGHNEGAYSASFSMAKGIVSLLVGIALEEGIIQSLDQAVADFIPEFTKDERREISFRHLLTMTSGLDWDEAYSSPFSPTPELYYGDDLYKQMTNLKLKHRPGTVWYYSSADTQILGIALERALGQRLSDYASEKLWQPLGAEQDASWSLDRENGTIKNNCCFNSTARDFARLGQLVLQKGKWHGKQLVPEAYLSEATRPYPNLQDEQGNPIDYYGYQFWIADFGDQSSPFFNGIMGQYMFVLPEDNAVVIRLGNSDDSSQDFQDIRAYEQASISILRD